MDPDSTKPAPTSATTTENAFPERIGGYRILGQLGKGGMGVVFEAEQDNPRRTVALKVLTAGVLNDDMRRRFELEAQVLGHLQHPCIAQIYEAGMYESAGGAQPFFAMELIRGVPLVRYAEEHELDTRTRLELIARISDGVQHAHQRGVIHRDLKPDNILVDDTGQPKILDFGLARATDADIKTVTLHTDVGQIMGTIPYMSPEQAAGDVSALDLRSDIYSLGVVAYELVSGHMPYAANDPQVLEALRVVREEDAKPLSSLNRSLRGDIETIIGKALEKDPARRYPSASALAEDIRRHLSDEPITARPPSAVYQLRKFARRNKALVTGMAAVFVALVIGLAGTARGYVAARADAQRAQSTADFFKTILEGVDPAVAQGADSTLLESILDDTAARIEAELAGLPLVAATIRSSMAAAYFAISEFEPSLAQAEAAHELFARELGEDSLEAITTHRAMVSALSHLGRADEAFEGVLVNLERAEAALGPRHPATDEIRSLLGILHLKEQRYEEAATVFEAVLAYRREHFDPDTTEVLVALNCLGLARLWQGRMDESEALLEEALEGRLRAFGDSHPDTIKAIHNLGGLYSTQERFVEAEALYRDALARTRKVFGEEHEATLENKKNLGELLGSVFRDEEALELLLAVYEAKLAMHGAQDSRTLEAEDALALRYRVTDRLELAEAHALHAVEGLRAWFGPEHPETLAAMLNLATVHSALGAGERAEELRLELIDIYTRTLGEEHAKTLFVTNDLATQYMSSGREAEAKRMFRRVLAARRHVLGESHSETLMTGVFLAKMLHDEGLADEAMPLHAAFLVGWSRTYGDDHSYCLDVSRKMARNLERIERLGPHEASIRVLLEYHERTLLPDSRETSSELVHLGQALVDLGRHDEAREVLENVLERFADTGAPPRVHWAYGAALLGLERLEDAEDMLVLAWEGSEDLPARERRRVALSLLELNEALERPDEADYWRDEAAALAE